MRAQAGPQPGHGQVIVGPLKALNKTDLDQMETEAARDATKMGALMDRVRSSNNPALAAQVEQDMVRKRQQYAPKVRRNAAMVGGIAASLPLMVVGGPEVLGAESVLEGANALAQHAVINGAASALPAALNDLGTGQSVGETARRAAHTFAEGAAVGSVVPLGLEGGARALKGGARALGAFRDYRDLRGVNRLLGDRFSIMTGENPGGMPGSPDVNAAGRAMLDRSAGEAGFTPLPATGRYTDDRTGRLLTEDSRVFPGMGERRAKQLGAAAGQNSIITQAGLHDLQSGQMYPSSGIALAKDGAPYTEVSLPNGRRVRFRLNLDFDHPVPSSISAPPAPALAPAEAAPMARVPTDFERNAASSLTDVLRDARATGSSGLATPLSPPQSVYDAAGGAPGLITRATGAGVGTLVGASQGDTNRERLRNAAIGGLTGFTGAAMLREAVPWLAEHIPETPGARFGDVLVGGEGGPGMRARPGVLGYHATFNQFDPKAIRGKPGDIGIHYATTPEQAMERAAAHAIFNNMHFNINNVRGPHILGLDPSTWPVTPRLLEADLNVKNPLEVRDLGNWDPSDVRAALQDSGFETPRSVLHQSDAAAQRAFRQILRRAGHDAYSYINEGEVPGMASGHFLPPLPQGLYVPFKQALYENQQEALVPFSRKQIQGIQEIDPVPLHNILDDLDLSGIDPNEQIRLESWFYNAPRKGAVDPRLLTRGAGAATGALAGATQGNTPGERARNAALGAGVGLAGARALEELPKLGPGVRSFWNDESGALRFRPKQADLPRALGKNTPQELKNEVLERAYNALGTRKAKENFARGMEDPTASRWYDPLPLLQLAAEGAGEADAPKHLRTFANYMATTTASALPWDNVKRALLFRGMEMRGLLTPEALREGIAVPEGMGHRFDSSHQKSIAKMLEAGGLDPIEQAKGGSFSENIFGNHTPTTIDQKMIELFRDLDPKLAELAMSGDAPKTWAYPLLERAAQRRAREALARGDFETAQEWMDAPANWQAIHWVGRQRGLTTARTGGLKAAQIKSRARNAGTLADIVKRQIDTGANLFGIKPSKVNEALWREGQPPLLPPGAPLLRR